ncbi:MAG: hypothetical protein F4Z01_04265 [Gammaproteobacteria bacterium]|nr:hypothetical protein [Gammaproteobacteria bacterium]MYF38791.1 hypothetical protein [Gammaproteobacteria bacterium]
MFNNPLESFHNTVAEAKAEREQLDRLLTVSSPRELLLLVLVIVLLVALTTWLVFGVLDRTVAANATVLEHSTTADNTKQVLRMDAWLSTELDLEVKTGMPVMIKPASVQGKSETIKGMLRSILSLDGSKDLMTAGHTPLVAKRIEITVDPEVEFSSDIGDECVVIIHLGRQSPIELIGTILL